MRFARLVLMFWLINPVAIPVAAIEQWRALAAYDRCVAQAGEQDSWMCE